MTDFQRTIWTYELEEPGRKTDQRGCLDLIKSEDVPEVLKAKGFTSVGVYSHLESDFPHYLCSVEPWMPAHTVQEANWEKRVFLLETRSNPLDRFVVSAIPDELFLDGFVQFQTDEQMEAFLYGLWAAERWQKKEAE